MRIRCAVVVVVDVAVYIVAVGAVVVAESLGKVFKDIMMNLEKTICL